jgi:hypothetical protein
VSSIGHVRKKSRGKSRVSDKQIKVTDKRMFTASGELRDEYKDLADAAPGKTGEADRAAASEDGGGGARDPAVRAAEGAVEAPGPAGPVGQDRIPTAAPTFLDLVGLLAEPVAVYLGDMRLPDGSTNENLDLARLHLDLLEVLRKSTQGNLDARESAFLDDLLYRLRLRYVEKKG